MGFFNTLISTWIGVLTKPYETYSKQKKAASVMEGAKHLAVAGLVGGAIGGLRGGALGLVAGAVLSLITVILGMLVLNALLYAVARVLGGKGSYGVQFHYTALYYAPIFVIASILALVPVVGGIINLLVFLYALYLLTIAMKTAHGFSTLRAVASWIILAIVFGIVLILLGIAATVALIGGYGAPPY